MSHRRSLSVLNIFRPRLAVQRFTHYLKRRSDCRKSPTGIEEALLETRDGKGIWFRQLSSLTVSEAILIHFMAPIILRRFHNIVAPCSKRMLGRVKVSYVTVEC